jgi:hypothetical protein
MKKSIATKWVKALRSGKYKQGEGLLKNTTKNGKAEYCCLGVLSEVCHIKSELEGVELPFDFYPELDLDSETGTPCDDYGDISKIEVKDKKGVKRSFYNLSAANDSGISFKRIATWIEKNFKLL